MLTIVNEAGTLIREARKEAGLSLRALANLSDVSYPTICRIESGRIDPTTGTLRKLLRAMDADLQLGRRAADPVPRLADLYEFWSTDNTGQDQPDWTRLRSFLDFLSRHPELSASAVRAKPPTSGSDFFDNLLAGIAEKVSDDAGHRRPAWTKTIPPLATTWESFGTPRIRAEAEAATPPQLADRGILIPAPSLWRHTA
jgi:transcriptional regulator with XRE-family HTH domain